MNQFDVVILGREYSLMCKEEEKNNLLSAVDYINKIASRIKESSKNYTNERVAIMVALQLAGEIMGAKISKDPDNKSTVVNDFSIGDISREIDLISSKIESILKK